MFNYFDTDHSGEISIDELRRGMTGCGMSRADLDQIFDELDVDGGGTVDLQEFTRVMREVGVFQDLASLGAHLLATGAPITLAPHTVLPSDVWQQAAALVWDAPSCWRSGTPRNVEGSSNHALTMSVRQARRPSLADAEFSVSALYADPVLRQRVNALGK